MSDLGLVWIDGASELLVDNFDLLPENGLRTAVIISLFSDARAALDDVLPSLGESRRGWWGDQFGLVEGDRTGSKLWLLIREKRTAQTLERAKRYAEESLAWMLQDSVASAVAVATSFAEVGQLTSSASTPNQYALVLAIDITRPDGTRESYRFATHWEAERLR